MFTSRTAWIAALFVAACSVCNALAQSPVRESGQNNPFVGTWKENVAKRKLAKTVTTYERQGDKIKVSYSDDPDGSYSFNMDGHETPHPYSTASKPATVSWKAVGDNAWERRLTVEGKLLTASKLTLSPDGKRLITTTTITKPDGKTISSTSVSERASGGTGLIGKWTSMPEKAKSSPFTLQIAPFGSGLKITSPDFKWEFTDTFDGKDNSLSGPTVPQGITVSSKRIDDHTIEETWKHNGKVASVETYTISSDGKTMTNNSRNPNVNEPSITVFDKQ